MCEELVSQLPFNKLVYTKNMREYEKQNETNSYFCPEIYFKLSISPGNIIKYHISIKIYHIDISELRHTMHV